MRLVSNLLITLLCSAPLLVPVPGFMMASWIGACWGGIFLAGIGVVAAQQRLLSLMHCGLTACLAWSALCAVTDLEPSACWLLVIALLAIGWFVGAALLPWNGSERAGSVNARVATKVVREQKDLVQAELGQAPFRIVRDAEPELSPFALHSVEEAPLAPCGLESARLTLWDLFCAMTLVGLVCWIAPHVDLELDLLCQVAPALIGGLILSGLAFQWARHNRLSSSLIIGAPLTLLGALLIVMPWAMLSTNTSSAMLWVIAGPVSVMAAQFVVVLAGVASMRSYELTNREAS